MATNEKNLVPNFNTLITDVVNPTTVPAVSYSNLVQVSLDSISYDYTGSSINKFIGNATYKDSFVVNYISLQKNNQ